MKNLDDSTATLAPTGSGLKLRSHKIRVEILDGPGAGTFVELPGPSATIGSGNDCGLVLADRAVSRHHLTIRIEQNRIRVIDMGSHNGTTVDGIQIRDAYARPNSCIVVGQTSLRLCMTTTIIELPLSANDRFGRLLGKSIAMRRVFAVLEKAAESDATVLLEGETGTGKEAAARGIHDASPRAGKPFVVFDCSAISASLMESELFGHKKGSFTGAVADRPGLLEEADGGTLFLDEIGELPMDMQPKLLRALENMEVRRVGVNQPQHVDVRIVAATNRPLTRAIDVGTFREDLYYRLAVITVRLPPLRERLEDIPQLVRQFEKDLSARMRATSPISSSVMDAFAEQSWPGNVRELRNAVSRVLALGPGNETVSNDLVEVDASHLGIRLDEPLLEGRDRIAQAYEKAYLKLMLEKTGGNVTKAADLAGVGRKLVHKAIKRHGLRTIADE